MRQTVMITALAIAISPWAVGATTAQTDSSSQVTVTQQPQAHGITEHTATIEWQTSVPSGAIVEYGTSHDNLDKREAVGWGGTTHRVTLQGLQPGTTYYFRVFSRKAKGSGTGVESAVSTFQTKGANQSAQAGSQSKPYYPNNPTGIAGDVKGKLALTSGPEVKNVSNDKATITWETDENAGTRVVYGTDRNNLSQTEKEGWGGTRSQNGFRHTVELKNLQPGTTYFYRVESIQGAGTGMTAKSDVESFQTEGANNASAANGSFNATTAENVNDKYHVQAGPVPQDVTDNSATMWWMTNGDTRTILKYGTAMTDLNQTATGPDGREHSVQLNNLQPGTTYYFAVLTKEDEVRDRGSFRTLDTNQANFKLKGPTIEYVSGDKAIIAWTTTVPANSVVRYGTDKNNLSQSARSSWGTNHRVTLQNLQPNTEYYFAVESSPRTGTVAKSEPAPFHTPAPGAQAMFNH